MVLGLAAAAAAAAVVAAAAAAVAAGGCSHGASGLTAGGSAGSASMRAEQLRSTACVVRSVSKTEYQPAASCAGSPSSASPRAHTLTFCSGASGCRGERARPSPPHAQKASPAIGVSAAARATTSSQSEA
eukprot:scaffold56824_cov50-Phaeocystis_antarctica.AAC.3